MYLARTTTGHPTRFYIRETYQDGNLLKSRNVFDLGTDPSRYIVYPGGRGYYFDEKIEETLQDLGLNPTQDDLDHIFWEFLDPAIKRVINGFQHTRSPSSPSMDMETKKVHLFDQRRVHYLRFAQIDQHDLSRMTPKLFRHLHHKSRDEIEQHFICEERILNPHELKRYIWAIFDMNAVFKTAYANNSQGDMIQERVDGGFIATLCELSQDESFWTGSPTATGLQEYLIRYAIMYFDHAFPVQTHFRDNFHDFMNRHRRYVPPQKVRMSMEEAGRLFETDGEKLKQMDARTFTRLYRRLAMKHHPDQGGDKRKFIKLTTLYRHLMRKKRN